ncbi:MAG TPA: hypothetical protein VN924_14100 [Bryobacteraceae bacterium]|nr:hypothetical protein [Bryobacteraceae bacterium]
MFQQIAVALALLLPLAGCGSLTRHGPIDATLAAYVSPDAVALAGIQVDQVRATPIYRALAKRLGQFPVVSEAHELLLTSDGKNVLAVARGDFAAQNQSDAITLIGKTIALGGSATAVRAAIDQSKSGVHAAPRDLMARVDALPADAQIWAVVAGWRGATADQLREMGNFANLDRVLRLVEGASLTVDLRAGVHAALVGDSRTEADAKTLADSLRALASLARMGVQRKPDLVRALDSILVKQEGRGVQVTVDITEDLAEKLVR